MSARCAHAAFVHGRTHRCAPTRPPNISGSFVGSRLASTAARNQYTQPRQNTKQLCYPCRGRPMCRPAATCCFRPRAHTQVRPYKVDIGLLTDKASKPGPLLVGPGGLSMQFQTPSRPPAKRAGVGGGGAPTPPPRPVARTRQSQPPSKYKPSPQEPTVTHQKNRCHRSGFLCRYAVFISASSALILFVALFLVWIKQMHCATPVIVQLMG